jgi:hypothetical protein
MIPILVSPIVDDAVAVQLSDGDPVEVAKEHQKAVSFEMDLSGKPGVFVGPNSFCDSRSERDEQCPAPKYFTDEIILRPLPTDKELILQGLVVND